METTQYSLCQTDRREPWHLTADQRQTLCSRAIDRIKLGDPGHATCQDCRHVAGLSGEIICEHGRDDDAEDV